MLIRSDHVRPRSYGSEGPESPKVRSCDLNITYKIKIYWDIFYLFYD